MYIPIVKPTSSSSGLMVDHNSMNFNRYALKWQSKGGKHWTLYILVEQVIFLSSSSVIYLHMKFITY